MRKLRLLGPHGLVVLSLATLPSCPDDNGNGPTASLSSVTVTPGTVVAGNPASGTVTLTGGAPSGGASVSLTSSAPQVTVPGTVTVASGSTSAAFNVTTGPVAAATTATITGNFGAQRTATLIVNPGLAGQFTVASLTGAVNAQGQVLLAAGSANACPLITPGPTLSCRFDGTGSTGGVTLYEWTYLVGNQTRTETSTTPTFTPTASGCGFFGGQTTGAAGGLTFVQMIVRLRIRDAAGTFSPVAENLSVRMFTQNQCGYGF